MSEFSSIDYSLNNGIARLVLNRPDRLNAFTVTMHEEIRSALASLRSAIDSGEARVLFITGAGRAFCAGQDLAERKSKPGDKPPDLGASIENNYKPLVLALRALPLPVLAAVNGVAAGAGASLALACDLVIAKESARFIMAFSRLGLLPDTGGSWSLPRLAGPARALGMAMLGEPVSASQAKDWGLIWDCVADEAFDEAVDALLLKLAAGPTLGYARTKQAIWSGLGNSLETQLDLERAGMRELGQSEDYREGVNAFAEKRDPQFKGC